MYLACRNQKSLLHLTNVKHEKSAVALVEAVPVAVTVPVHLPLPLPLFQITNEPREVHLSKKSAKSAIYLPSK